MPSDQLQKVMLAVRKRLSPRGPRPAPEEHWGWCIPVTNECQSNVMGRLGLSPYYVNIVADRIFYLALIPEESHDSRHCGESGRVITSPKILYSVPCSDWVGSTQIHSDSS